MRRPQTASESKEAERAKRGADCNEEHKRRGHAGDWRKAVSRFGEARFGRKARCKKITLRQKIQSAIDPACTVAR